MRSDVPEADQAELALLGCAILDPTRTMALAGELIRIGDFRWPLRQDMWDAIALRVAKRLPVDTLLISQDLGGSPDVLDLAVSAAHTVPTAANAEHYADQVRGAAAKRRLQASARYILELVAEGGDPLELVERAAAAIQSAGGGLARARNVTSLAEAVQDEARRLFRSREEGARQIGVLTGIQELDDATGGMGPGELWVLGARPAMGKSALAMDIADGVATAGRGDVLVFSAEMIKQALAQRWLARQGVNLRAIRRGLLDEKALERIAAGAGAAEARAMWLDDTRTPSLAHVRATARLHHGRRPLALVVVDYLQLLDSGMRNEEARESVTRISNAMKTLAGELEIPVLALSQLNRDLERRDDKRPKLADLRESGAIEQDADVVAFLYRDAVYNPRAERDEAEVILAKQRNEEPCVVRLRWDGAHQRFRSRVEEPAPGAGRDVMGLDGMWSRDHAAARAGVLLDREGSLSMADFMSLVTEEGCRRGDDWWASVLSASGVAQHGGVLSLDRG